MKRYKLLKDLPSAKAGTLFLQDRERGIYIQDGFGISSFDKSVVEGNDSWFEEIPSHPTKEEIATLRWNKGTLEYNELISCLSKFESSLKEQLIEKIEEYAANYNYPSASVYKDGIKSAISLLRDFKT